MEIHIIVDVNHHPDSASSQKIDQILSGVTSNATNLASIFTAVQAILPSLAEQQALGHKLQEATLALQSALNSQPK